MPQNETIHFAPNVPVTLSVLNPEGEFDFDTQLGRYQTADGRSFSLPRSAVVKLNTLDVQPSEEIGICQRVSGKRGEIPVWDVWLTPKTEQARAEQEKAQDEAPQPLPPVQSSNNGKQPVPIGKGRKARFSDQPRLFDKKGTGTYGPAPAPLPALAAATRHMPIPWNVAFREVSAWVSKELARNGLQWSDQAQQAMTCTVLIQEAKAGRIGPWEREQ